MTKKWQRSPVKGHNYEFSIIFFSRFRAFRMLHLSKPHMILKVLAENEIFYFWNRALRAVTGYCTQQKAKFLKNILNWLLIPNFSDAFPLFLFSWAKTCLKNLEWWWGLLVQLCFLRSFSLFCFFERGEGRAKGLIFLKKDDVSK